MRKLLNTLYITQEQAYLSLDGENLVCLLDNDEKFRIPFDNVESIVCFSYLGCSPALMGKCLEKLIPISFLSPNGKFFSRIGGVTRGNVHLRVAQIDKFRECGLLLAQNTMAAKFANTSQLIRRSRHDNPQLREDAEIDGVLEFLKSGVESLYQAETIEEIVGIEGSCAHQYFSVFGRLFSSPETEFTVRTKRPPLDPVNAALSFL